MIISQVHPALASIIVLLLFAGVIVMWFYAQYWYGQHLEDRTLARDLKRIRTFRNQSLHISQGNTMRRLKRVMPRLHGSTPAPQLEAPRFPCPYCGESIPVAAAMCRFCKTTLSDYDKK